MFQRKFLAANCTGLLSEDLGFQSSSTLLNFVFFLELFYSSLSKSLHYENFKHKILFITEKCQLDENENN